MTIDQLIYVSRATVHVDRKELHHITEVSAERNAPRGVTGALVFCNGYFLQILEGEGHVLSALLEKISRDDRHTDVHVVGEFPNAERMFADWTMSCLHESTLTEQQLARVEQCLALTVPAAASRDVARDAKLLLSELRYAIAEESSAHRRRAA